jgi:putative peptide zinc metalloprotease protein
MAQLRPTFSESWYRVAGLKARLRGSTQISRQHYRGERWYVVRDPAGNQYHRLSSAAYRFVGLLDGSRTVGEAWDLVGGQLADDAPTQPEVIQILSQLHAANLLEANITPDAGVLLRRHKQLQKRQLQGRLMNVLFPRIPLWDPDRFLKKWMPPMRWVLSKLGAIIWLAVVIGAIAALVPYWSDLKAAAAHAIDAKTNSINYLWLFLTFCVIKLIHELGHAFTCRRFGGEVHELGIMFLVFVPAPYVDASSAWALPSKWQRAFVGAGGMIFELFVAALLAFVWIQTHNGAYPLVAQLSYNAMLIASVSTVIFNANPLLRYDGYYILSDLLEIPNLSQKSKDYSLGLIKRHIFRVKSPLPLPPPGQRVWLFIYSIASGIYRVLVGITIILVVTGQVPVLGVLMALGGVITWLVVPVFKIANYLLLEPELHRKRFRAAAFVGAVAGAIFIAIGVIRFPVHYEATGMAEAEEGFRFPLNAKAGGFVTKVVVTPGQWIHKGDPILICRDDALVTNLRKQEADFHAREAHRDYARVVNPNQLDADNEYLAHLTEQIAIARQEVEDLTVAAPSDGYVIAGAIDELKGKYVRPGEPLNITVAQTRTLTIYGLLDQKDAALAFYEKIKGVEVRFAGRRGEVIKNDDAHPDRVRIVRWQPGATNDALHESLTTKGGEEGIPDPNDKSGKKLAIAAFPVVLAVQNDGNFYPGQRAYLRFDMEKRPLMWQWARRFWQLVQQHSANNRWL